MRRRLVGELRAAGKADQAAAPGKGMWALRKNPGGLSPGQPQSLARIAADNKQLYRACTLDHAVSNGRAEGINTQLAALTTRARGFHSAEAFIAMAELTCGGLCPDLPGR